MRATVLTLSIVRSMDMTAATPVASALATRYASAKSRRLDLIQLERAQQQAYVDHDHRRQRDRGPHQLGDAGPAYLIEGLEHVDALGEHEVSECAAMDQ